MDDNENLASRLAEKLPAEILALLRVASAEAAARAWRIYLVGGTVRDIVLDRTGFDLDLSVEGDAIGLANAIAASPNDVTVHHRFNTARVKWGGHHIDLARSREETYTRPGALPTVRPGHIEKDLFRRDFTINAMAVSLNLNDWGRLIDELGGRKDIRQGLIRVIHPKSFVDDATRIWRAVRYEQRLGFCIEPETLKLIDRDRQMLRTITADRLRYELDCILREAFPEKVFRRADDLGLLATWHPSLKGDTWLSEACAKARSPTETPHPDIYLALLAWRLTASQKEEFIASLRFTKAQTRVLRDSETISRNAEKLASPQAKPSSVFAALHGLSGDALTAAKCAMGSDTARLNIDRFENEWRRISSILTGEDLKRLGVSQGPDLKWVLEKLRDLRLDGVISSRGQEETFVLDWLNCKP
ncbi:CCA tRNA nucleotidyltransferase [Dehalogenimonas etheniformans]|uniref:CCA tRNA nucleotidyltransferase n=1 Tax=Dehalogenimonas etheniformans TaxID=1536648 RepID=A0A2P5P7C1_9CHLR|nr:CCA tRNA nucleotidyltransferase [Dehalogenimonas etheniformans]PPD58192.1 CCA tRNA nucleotidyltransferase [Dehalogenimonas etheniformans]QNT75601.1 CCA tRNA nucleotidyltransferase [Dehalogenimonas etheniformans]